MLITGFGNVMLSSTIGALSAHNVSPVRMSLKPIPAQISPASIFSIGFWWFECIWNKREIRSFLPVRIFNTVSPALSTPLYTRIKHKRPTYGSVAILNARPQNGSFASTFLSSSSPLDGLVPMIAGTSTGLGRNAATASNSRWIPLFLKAEPHNTGTIICWIVARRITLLISSTVIESGSSKKRSNRESSNSATDSISFARYSLAVSTKSSGMSMYL